MIARILALALLALPSTPAATDEPVHARRAMVVSAEPHATRIGVAALRDGGNAVDAAVAVGLALAVTHPAAGNLGGGGFMLIRFPDGGSSTFLDFRETAPAAARREMYLDAAGQPTDESVVGYRASGVPGTVRGLSLALERYGSKPWEELLESARRLADEGFEISYGLAESLRHRERLKQFPESVRVFLDGGRFFEYGETLRQPDLAATLQRLAWHGPDEFYEGETARRIAADMRRHGGLITREDLAGYRPVERRPLRSTYRGYEVLTAPPPSSGGVGVIQMLRMLENSDYAADGAGSASAIHVVAEAMRRFFADRAAYLGDADFADIPVERLTSAAYARERAASIHPDRASTSEEVGPGLEAPVPESRQTTHYSIVDEDGLAVAVTYTLNGSFGSGVTAAGTGVLLNNEMDDFTAKPGEPNMFGVLQSGANAIEPGKRPLSSMTPTMLVRDGRAAFVAGAPGGPTIISTVLQVILNWVDFGMNVRQATDFPRFHHQWEPDELRMEGYGFSPDTVRLLEARGHKIRRVSSMGRAMAIAIGDEGLTGAADARSEGLAAGY